MLFLHPFPLDTLVPHLIPHLPLTISTLGAIYFQTNIKSTFPAWASFPPSSSPPPSKPWIVLVAQAPPSRLQLRVFCSAEGGEGPTEDAERLVRAAVEEVRDSEVWKALAKAAGEDKVIVGAVHSIWLKALGAEDVPRYGIWLAAAKEVEGGGGLKEEEGNGGELELRKGQQGDVGDIISTSKIPRSVPYITSLLPFSSVVATTSSFPSPFSPSAAEYVLKGETPVAWILTHSDMSLGSLYTQPSHRRQGLARRVVEHRLASAKSEGEGGKLGGVCYVERGNLGSEGLWRSMGWERGWETGWVYF